MLSVARILMLVLVGSTLTAATASRSQATAATDCLRFDREPDDQGQGEERARRRTAWVELCVRAVAADPHNDALKRSLARAYAADGRRAEAIEVRRELAAKGDAASAYELYDTFKSYERDRIEGEKLITRAEAEASLRRAAELGDAYAVWVLAVLLDRGSTVKRSNDDAIVWAERALATPPKDTTPVDIEVRLGHFLTKSQDPDKQARGVRILERYSGLGRADADAYLARVLRGRDPMRARKLLERSLARAPGHAIPLLSEMLIKGEGGPIDVKRALSLLQGGRARDVGAVRGALGRLMLKGELVPLNLQEGVNLLRQEAVWDIDAAIALMEVLVAQPALSISRPEKLLYDIYEAAELDEPGALDSLLDALLSQNAQFADRKRGCALITVFAAAGRAVAQKHLARCS